MSRFVDDHGGDGPYFAPPEGEPDLRCCNPACRQGFNFHHEGACDVYVTERCDPTALDYIENFCSEECRTQAYPGGENSRCSFTPPVND